jgi:hypothetical protein
MNIQWMDNPMLHGWISADDRHGHLTYDLSMQHRVVTAVIYSKGFTMGDRDVSVFPTLRRHIS